MKVLLALGLGVALVGQSAVSWAAPSGQDSTPEQVAYGAGSALGTLIYSPVKGGFCLLGAIAGGFAFPFGGAGTAGKIVGAACRGTWVITPEVLKGHEHVEFIGPMPDTVRNR